MTLDTNMNPESLVTRTLKTLLTGIVDGDYASVLPPQDRLAESLGVSRTVMREAIVILRFCHVLEVRPKTGTKIRPKSEWKSAIVELAEEEPGVTGEQFSAAAVK